MARIITENPYHSEWTGSQVDEALKLIQQNWDTLINMPKFQSMLDEFQEKLRILLDETIPRINETLFDQSGNSKFLPITGGTLKGDRPQIASEISNVTPSAAAGSSLLYFPNVYGYVPAITFNVDNSAMSIGATNSPEPRISCYYDNSLLCHVDNQGKLFGAVWNDLAEFRRSDETEAGRVICENGDGSLSRSYKRLQPGAMVVSDTYGFAIGETDDCKTPVAIAGRVLAYPYEDWWCFEPGQPVCAGPNGTVSMMSRREARKYPDRIIGTVSELPTYEKWGKHNTVVNGRIWIKVK